MNITPAVNFVDTTPVAIFLRDGCTGVEGNPDLSGIGVRIALYVQSAINSTLSNPSHEYAKADA